VSPAPSVESRTRRALAIETVAAALGLVLFLGAVAAGIVIMRDLPATGWLFIGTGAVGALLWLRVLLAARAARRILTDPNPDLDRLRGAARSAAANARTGMFLALAPAAFGIGTMAMGIRGSPGLLGVMLAIAVLLTAHASRRVARRLRRVTR
jgi:hypothetical protein